ncbi:muts domain V-domain-containing protein [Flagelloscypha sp. PMI_526]|nr:muts domain V-domain-containing protein [Flagelloscypha sp. PMI_526]
MNSDSSTQYIPSRPSTARPWTAQSRPGTSYSRPQTAQSSRREGNYVVAVLEGRGVSREVGIAALDRDTGHCVLVQLGDCQTYVRTLHQLQLYNPSLILVPDTFLSASDAALAAPGKNAASTSLLVECLREEFPYSPIEVVGRKYWNDASGLDFVIQLCVEDDERAGTLVSIANKYYALSAVSALFKHAELKMNTRFAAASLRIRYTPVEGTMMIDPETIRNLELVGNLTFKKSSHSLFGTMNFTYTAMAARLLRNNLISPIIAEATLNARLDVVEELVQSEDLFTDVRDALRGLNRVDFDKLIAAFASSEAKPSTTSRPAATRVSQMLDLRNLVKNLPVLQRALRGSQSQLMRIIHDMLSDERIQKIHDLIQIHLNDDSTPAKGGLAAINARIYAVKANRNRLLDVARETYKENVGDIYQLNRTLSEEHELPLTLVYQDTGFVFCLKKKDMHDEEVLPQGFLSGVSKKGKWTFSSLELKKMNARMKDALDETLLLSDKIIQDLVEDIIVDIGALYKASEAVALIDMLWSFAHISIMRNYVRPEFTGTLAIKSGRHPILETIQKAAGTLVPNDVYCDEPSAFQIVQGPNMSGKSTYLRQTGLLTIMAMCGSFVPAEYASFRLHDALLTRLSNDDDIEKSLSTFANEMATSAMILSMATEKSLLLIDELGRGTSPREGVGISYAIGEELVKKKAFVFFATHFSELSTILARLPSVINLHLSVQRSRPTSSNIGLTFQYKIRDGAPENTAHYGLDLARLADLPEDVLQEAKRVSTVIETLHARTKEQSESNKIVLRRKALLRVNFHFIFPQPVFFWDFLPCFGFLVFLGYTFFALELEMDPRTNLFFLSWKLKAQLTQAYNHSALPDEELRLYLAGFQKDLAKAFLGAGLGGHDKRHAGSCNT